MFLLHIVRIIVVVNRTHDYQYWRFLVCRANFEIRPHIQNIAANKILKGHNGKSGQIVAWKMHLGFTFKN